MSRIALAFAFALVSTLVCAAGCFNPSVRECAITCSAANPCPGGASCLSDGFCHASPEDSLCSVQGDGGPDPDVPAACGNGVVELGIGEECDDQNVDSGDGCSDECAVEAGFVCVEQPSQCRTNPSAAGDLVITELLANPTGPDGFSKEWIEIHNPTATDFDLRGIVLRDDGGESFEFNESLVLVAGGHLVVGQSTNLAVNGGAPVVAAYSSVLMANVTDELEIAIGDTVIDRIEYVSPPDGASLSLSAATYTAADNDIAANLCAGVDSYGDNGDLGSPGVMNATCP